MTFFLFSLESYEESMYMTRFEKCLFLTSTESKICLLAILIQDEYKLYHIFT